MKSDIIVGGTLICSGVYALIYVRMRPQSLPPEIKFRTIVLLCIGMIIGGLVAIIAPLDSRIEAFTIAHAKFRLYLTKFF